MIQADSPLIYTYARNLVFISLQSILSYENTSGDEIKQELDSWVDAITLDTLPEFCNLLDATQKMTVQHSVIVSNAWQQYNSLKILDNASFSPIVTAALASFASDPDNFSDSFGNLICTVVTASLVQNVNPMALASVIRFLLTDAVDPKMRHMHLLVQYATALLEQEDNLTQKACFLLDGVFGESSTQSKVAHLLVAKSVDSLTLDEIYLDVMSVPSKGPFILRQCIHHFNWQSSNEVCRESFDHLLLKLLPILAEVGGDQSCMQQKPLFC